MQLGIVGLGKMGGNMRDRLRQAGHTVVGYDTNPEISDSSDLPDLVSQLTDSVRVVWLMIPHEYVAGAVEELAGLLGEGDIVIDGGNSKWVHDQEHAAVLSERGIHYLDCGVSGGVWGITEGYALMVGGEDAVVQQCMPIFDALKPPGDDGFIHAGPIGAGHFTKMVHNGIEYGMMQAYAEGWELLQASHLVPDVASVFQSWRSGTVVRSWLLDLLVDATSSDPNLDEIAAYAQDSGEGRWTVEAGIEHAVPTPAISAALYARFASRQDASPAMKAIAAMRNQFGGHAVKRSDDSSQG